MLTQGYKEPLFNHLLTLFKYDKVVETCNIKNNTSLNQRIVYFKVNI